MIGTSGSYAVNTTGLTLQPTVGKWISRDVIGVDGNAHAVYPTPRGFELNWQLVSVAEFQQIENFFNTISATGSVTVDIPEWNAPEYRFQRYSGVVLNEPEFENYFNGYIESVRLLLVNIVT